MCRSPLILTFAAFAMLAATSAVTIAAQKQQQARSGEQGMQKGTDGTKKQSKNEKETSGNPETKSRKQVSFKNVGLRILRPDGFVKADGFDGFHNKGGSSVMLTRMKGAINETSAGFRDKQLLQKSGMKMVSRKTIELDGLNGYRFEIEQAAAGRQFRKFVIMLGDDVHTRMIMATFPKSDSDRFGKMLKSVIDSAAVIPVDESAEDIGYIIDPKGLKRANGLSGKTLVFLKTGKLPQKDPREPKLIVSPSLGNVRTTNWPDDATRKQFALKRLNNFPAISISKVVSEKPVKIDGSTGFEFVADAIDTKKDVPMRIYQVVLFGDRDYFVIVGMVGRENSDEYMKNFAISARTLKRDPK